MKGFHLFLAICISLSAAFAQSNLDSLLRVHKKLKQQGTESQSLLMGENLYALGVAYEDAGDYLKSLAYLNQALQLFKVKKELSGLAKTYTRLAEIYREQGKNELGFQFYKKAMSYYETLKDNNGVIECLIGQGVLSKNLSNYPKALKLFSQSLDIAQKTGNDVQMGQIYRNMGIVYRYQGLHKQELKYQFKALKINQKVGKQVPIGYSYGGVGSAYFSQGNYPAAIANQFKALAIFEKFGRQSNVAYTYNALGNIYTEQKKYTLALDYYTKSLKIRQNSKDKPGTAYVLEKMGYVYGLQAKVDKARKYLKQALKINQEIDQKSWLAYCYEKLGELELSLKQYNQALEYFKESYKLRETLGEKVTTAASAVGIGKVLYYQKKYQEAIPYLKQGVQAAQEFNGLEVLRDGSGILARSYQALGDYQNAFKHHLIFKQMTDSLFNKDNTAQITRLSTTYQFQKEKDSLSTIEKQKQLAFDAEIKTRKTNQRFTFVGLGLVSVLLVVLLLFFLEKNKSNRKLSLANNQLEESNEEIIAKNEEVQSANEEIMAVNDSLTEALDLVEDQKNAILSSITYAQRIQKAMLPNTKRLREVFPDHFIFFRPRDIVSGDFYWFAELESRPVYASQTGFHSTGKVLEGFTNQKYILAAIDCTGHGVPGAFMSMIANNLLNYIVNKKHISDADLILNQLHVEIKQALHQSENDNEDGMEMSLVVIEPEKKQMQFAGAKNPLWYIQNGEFNQIRGDRLPIGGERWSKERVFTRHDIDLNDPISFYMFSDGYPDQFGGSQGKRFMKKYLRELLEKNADYPMVKQKQELVQTLTEWMEGHNEQIDDILVMGVRIEDIA